MPLLFVSYTTLIFIATTLHRRALISRNVHGLQQALERILGVSLWGRAARHAHDVRPLEGFGAQRVAADFHLRFYPHRLVAVPADLLPELALLSGTSDMKIVRRGLAAERCVALFDRIEDAHWRLLTALDLIDTGLAVPRVEERLRHRLTECLAVGGKALKVVQVFEVPRWQGWRLLRP
jgi:hypothetical protein